MQNHYYKTITVKQDSEYLGRYLIDVTNPLPKERALYMKRILTYHNPRVGVIYDNFFYRVFKSESNKIFEEFKNYSIGEQLNEPKYVVRRKVIIGDKIENFNGTENDKVNLNKKLS